MSAFRRIVLNVNALSTNELCFFEAVVLLLQSLVALESDDKIIINGGYSDA